MPVLKIEIKWRHVGGAREQGAAAASWHGVGSCHGVVYPHFTIITTVSLPHHPRGSNNGWGVMWKANMGKGRLRWDEFYYFVFSPFPQRCQAPILLCWLPYPLHIIHMGQGVDEMHWNREINDMKWWEWFWITQESSFAPPRNKPLFFISLFHYYTTKYTAVARHVGMSSSCIPIASPGGVR